MLQFISSKDGSPTIFDDSIGECYHSRNGALSESKHVFIQHGLEYLLPSHTEIRLLEVGLGTGLNALLSWNLAEQQKLQLHYSALEPYPVPFSFLQTLALSPAFLDKEDQQRLLKIHQAPFEETLQLSLFFSLFKSKTGLEDFYTEKPFHLVYFDAFSPKKTPHLWVEAVFEKLLPANVSWWRIGYLLCKRQCKANPKKSRISGRSIARGYGKKRNDPSPQAIAGRAFYLLIIQNKVSFFLKERGETGNRFFYKDDTNSQNFLIFVSSLRITLIELYQPPKNTGRWSNNEQRFRLKNLF